MLASLYDLQFTSNSPTAMNVLVVFACVVAVASARPQQVNFDRSSLQDTFSQLPSVNAAFETEGAVAGLDKVGERISEIILKNTPSERQNSMKRIIELSDGFLDSVGTWVNELPSSAFTVPEVNIPQVVIPEFEVPEEWKFPDIPVPEVYIPEVPTFNQN